MRANVIPDQKLLGIKWSPALHNPAVAHCARVYEMVYQISRAHKQPEYTSVSEAGKAFSQAMPLLSGYQNICDYIACVSFGAHIGVFSSEVTSLMYAAQVALTTIAPGAKTQTRPALIPPPQTPPPPPETPQVNEKKEDSL